MPPDSSASAAVAEPASTSGTGATAPAIMGEASANAIVKKLRALIGRYFFPRALSTSSPPDNSAIAAVAEPASTSGTAGVSPAIKGEASANAIIKKPRVLMGPLLRLSRSEHQQTTGQQRDRCRRRTGIDFRNRSYGVRHHGGRKRQSNHE